MKFALIYNVNINKYKKYKNQNYCDNQQRGEEKVLRYRTFQHRRAEKEKNS